MEEIKRDKHGKCSPSSADEWIELLKTDIERFNIERGDQNNPKWLDLSNCDLTDLIVTGANLINVSFENSNLSRSIFDYTWFNNSIFTGATLRACDVRYSWFIGAYFHNTSLLNITGLDQCNLKNVTMYENDFEQIKDSLGWTIK